MQAAELFEQDMKPAFIGLPWPINAAGISSGRSAVPSTVTFDSSRRSGLPSSVLDRPTRVPTPSGRCRGFGESPRSADT